MFAPQFEFFLNGFQFPVDARQFANFVAAYRFNHKQQFVALNPNNPYVVDTLTFDSAILPGQTDPIKWFEQHQYTFDPQTCLVIRDEQHSDLTLFNAFLASLGQGQFALPASAFGALGPRDVNAAISGIGAPAYYGSVPLYPTLSSACDPYDVTRVALQAFEAGDLAGGFAPLNATYDFSINGYVVPSTFRGQIASVFPTAFSSFGSNTLYLLADPVDPTIVHFLSLDKAVSTGGTTATWFEAHAWKFDPTTCKVVKDTSFLDTAAIAPFLQAAGVSAPPFSSLGPLVVY